MNPVLTRRGVLRAAAGALAVPGRARSATTLSLRITDEEGDDRIPARVLVRDSLGADHVPEGAVVVPIGPDRWFVSSGMDQLPLPPGEYRLRAERGTEFVPVKRTVDVSGTREEVHVRLRRWVNMRRRGYRSGENHLHVPARDLPGMLAAEDLDFGSSLYWWNGPNLEHPGGAEAVRQMRFGGVETVASVFDAELEYAWGAVYLVGLRAPLETPSEKGRANWAYIAEARQMGGLVCYQGGWSREVLVDALLGLVDVVNVCNNNFHRYKFQPRSFYSNLLEVTGFTEYPDTPEGMVRMNTDAYYRLLNCGLRLAAGGGSATGVKSSPAGYNRCYVRTRGEASLEGFLGGWRQGKNFVTNGPMVFLSAGDGDQPGDTIEIPAGGRQIAVKATAISAEPLRSLEIVLNGRVAAKAKIPPDVREASLDARVDLAESSWIAARATEEDRFLGDSEIEPYVLNAPGSRRPARERPSRLRFAHTSPIYASASGRPVRVNESVSEARKMLDAFGRFARETATEDHRKEILDRLAEARGRLKL